LLSIRKKEIMGQEIYKKCAVCGELVLQTIIECPKCGRGVFETQKNAFVPFKPPTAAAQTNLAESQTSILVYVFCNGFRPDEKLLNTLSLAWLIQEYGRDRQTLETMSAVLHNAAKYGFSIPQVPSDS
jgi:endogenous inhibitor of DNA gyrase (YacG/DUF329 family)